MTWYVHTRADGFRRWVCVARHESKAEALADIPALKAQDDPMWSIADYLVIDSLNPMDDTEPTVAGESREQRLARKGISP